MLPADLTTIPEGASLNDKMDLVLSLLIKQSKQLKNYVNFNNQLLRGSSIRLLGFPMADEEVGATDGGKALAGRIYDKIIKPILVAAKTKGAIPNCGNTIDKCNRAGRASSDKSKPPPVVIKLCSKQIRLAILRNKKASVPAPSTADSACGIKRLL